MPKALACQKAEVDVLLDSLAFSMIQRMLAIWYLVALPFLNPSWTSGNSQFTFCWSLTWRIFNCRILTSELLKGYALSCTETISCYNFFLWIIHSFSIYFHGLISRATSNEFFNVSSISEFAFWGTIYKESKC